MSSTWSYEIKDGLVATHMEDDSTGAYADTALTGDEAIAIGGKLIAAGMVLKGEVTIS